MYLREILESEYGNKPINEVWGAVAGGLSRIFQPLARNLGWLHRSELAAETLFATIGEGWNPFDEIYQWQQGNITHGEALVSIRNFLGTISFIFAAIRGIKLLENIWKNVKPIKNLVSFIVLPGPLLDSVPPKPNLWYMLENIFLLLLLFIILLSYIPKQLYQIHPACMVLNYVYL